jgi:hypothetical protein
MVIIILIGLANVLLVKCLEVSQERILINLKICYITVRPGARLIPIIPAILEEEIKRILFQIQSGQIVHQSLSQKNPSQKRAG